jgi:hypothetical protein
MGIPTWVNVGDVMVTEYDYLAQEQAKILQASSGSFWRGRQPLPAGTSLRKMQYEGQSFWCPMVTGEGSACLMDTDDDLSFDRAYTLNIYGMPMQGNSINPIQYHKESGVVQSGFKYEITYHGVHGSFVSMSYREYSQDLARPAFQQDLNYTLESEATTVHFRDVRITIHGADNNSIHYTVLSGLD